MFLISFFQPAKNRLVLRQSGINDGEVIGGHVTLTREFSQIRKRCARLLGFCRNGITVAEPSGAPPGTVLRDLVRATTSCFSDQTHCPAVVNSSSDDQHPAISKDGLSLDFTSNRPGGLGDFDLWVVKRGSVDDCWKAETLRNLGPVVNSSAEDVAPNLSTDGHWLFFHSKRGDGCYSGTVRELWVTHRRDADEDFGEFGWGAPTNLGCAMGNGFGINQANADNAGPAPFEDQSGNLFLYFTPSLTPNNAALADIYVSACPADLNTCNTLGGWGTGNKVDSLSSPFRDTRMAIRRRDGLEMIFSTGRPGSLGSENLWVSTRATTMDDCLPPVPINCEWKVNVSAIQNSLVPPVSCPPGLLSILPVHRQRQQYSSTPTSSTGLRRSPGTAPSFSSAPSAPTSPASQAVETCTSANGPNCPINGTQH